MSKRLPIVAARNFCKAHDLRYVVIFARAPGDVSHVVTYGNTIEESKAAAQLGNKMKRGLGWPEKSQATPAKVLRHQRKLAEKIANALFVDGAAQLAIKKFIDGNTTGWSREVVVDRVAEIIRTS